MAYKTLIFGTNEAYEKLKPFYEAEVKRGNLEIVARATLENDKVNLIPLIPVTLTIERGGISF